MTKWRIDPKLLREFLAYVLDRYKAGDMSQASAIGAIDHLFGALDLPKGVGSDPINYMKNVMAGDLGE
jgi:hypothetical protein